MHETANPQEFMYLLFYRMCVIYIFYILVPSFKHSWSINQLWEHEFFFLGRFFNSLIFVGIFLNVASALESCILLFDEIFYIMSQFSSIFLGMIDQLFMTQFTKYKLGNWFLKKQEKKVHRIPRSQL